VKARIPGSEATARAELSEIGSAELDRVGPARKISDDVRIGSARLRKAEAVESAAASKRIVAAAALQRVVAEPALQIIRRGIAFCHIGEIAADEVLDRCEARMAGTGSAAAVERARS